MPHSRYAKRGQQKSCRPFFVYIGAKVWLTYKTLCLSRRNFLAQWDFAVCGSRDFGPVRTCRCYPSYAFGAGSSRSRSHGRLRRPKALDPQTTFANVEIPCLPVSFAKVDVWLCGSYPRRSEESRPFELPAALTGDNLRS